jgi:NADPH-dependent 2,4-dienoyl-CoA reductase/sulfur reductase-like enzyme
MSWACDNLNSTNVALLPRQGRPRRCARRGELPPTIAIVGGGASGTLAALQLLRLATVPIRVAIMEPRASLGAGIAYSTVFDSHLLNIPPGR